MSPEIANWEIFIWALFRLGGAGTFIDIEEISLRAYQLAPNRLSWRTRADLPDYKKCAKALQEAERRKPRLLVKTPDGLKRQLSVEGQEWTQANATRLVNLLENGRAVEQPRTRPEARLIGELERSAQFSEWKSSGHAPAEKWEVAELLRCSPDSDVKIWSLRVQMFRSAAFVDHRDDVRAFLDKIIAEHPEWFGEVSDVK